MELSDRMLNKMKKEELIKIIRQLEVEIMNLKLDNAYLAKVLEKTDEYEIGKRVLNRVLKEIGE